MEIRKIKRILILTIIALIVVQVVYLSVYITLATNINNTEPEIVVISIEERNVLELTNKYRKENGLSELKVDARLQQLAKLKAQDLENNNYFSHTSEILGTPFEMMKNNNVEYKIAGENLAGNINEKKAVEAWINSPSHRDNLLEKEFDYTGICVIESSTYGKIFVQLFLGK